MYQLQYGIASLGRSANASQPDWLLMSANLIPRRNGLSRPGLALADIMHSFFLAVPHHILALLAFWEHGLEF